MPRARCVFGVSSVYSVPGRYGVRGVLTVCLWFMSVVHPFPLCDVAEDGLKGFT